MNTINSYCHSKKIKRVTLDHLYSNMCSKFKMSSSSPNANA